MCFVCDLSTFAIHRFEPCDPRRHVVVKAMRCLLLCSALATAAGIPRRTRRICRGGVAAVEWTRLSGGAGTANATTYDAAAVAALEERVAASTPQHPYAGFAETTALLADGCGDVAALASRLEPTYRLHIAVLRARAAKAFADALDANDSPERIAEQAVEAEFAFADEIERCTSLHYDTDDAVEAFRDTVSNIVEDALAAQSLESLQMSDGDLPSQRERLLAFIREHKRFLFRGGALLLNIIQARVAARQARKAAERRDREQPKIPLF